MAGALAGVVQPAMRFNVQKVPVGKAAILAVAMGIGDVGKALVAQATSQFAPQLGTWSQLLAGFGFAWVLANVKGVKNIVGADVAELAGLAVMADTINDQFRLRENTTNILGNLFGQKIVSKSPPVALPAGNRVTTPMAATSVYSRAFGG